MSAELERLKQIRKNIRSSVTRVATYIEMVDRENIDVISLKLRLKILEEARINFQTVEADIGVLDKELTPEKYEKELDDFENRYYDLAAQAEQLIKTVETLEAQNVSRSSTRSPSVSRITSNPLNSQVRLPKIDLPIFGGAYEDWQPFYSTFKSLIHENTTLNNIQKFHYLKSALKGEATEIIKSLEITEGNYRDAWLRLRERYDNKKLAVQGHIRAIFELPIMRRENVVILRQILDGVEKHMRALKALSRPIDNWDDLIIYVVTNKLDLITIKAWENDLQASELPTYKQLTDFLSKRCQTLEAVAKQAQITNTSKPSISGRVTATYSATTKIRCSYCNGEHHIFYCDKFQKLSAFQRTKEAKAKGLCLNCLRRNHQAKDCISGACKICSGKHNTMLHIKSNTKDKPGNNNNENKQSETICNATEGTSGNISLHNFSVPNADKIGQVLLSTAIIKVRDRNGQYHNCRVLLDNGSQSNFITEEFADRLHLKKNNIDVAIKGISQSVTNAAKSTDITLQSRFDTFQTKVRCIVLPTITQNLPLVDLNRKQFQIPQNIRLADPSFHRSSKIDMLLGSEKFWDLICVGQISLGKGKPILQKTVFGWIVAGGTYSDRQIKQTHCNFATTDNLNDFVHRFWEIEDCSDGNKLSAEEIYCEEVFANSHKRTDSGRYIVKLPVNEQLINNLGDSKETALKRFYSLERSLIKNPERRIEYTKFINEYEKLGHMRRVADASPEHNVEFYLPHHAVIKESSETTKLRVVFDASSKGSTGISLNDALYKGPIIQPDIFTILLRFRSFKHVLCADIEKMYRQVLISDQQASLQRIFWRNSTRDELQIFELMTLTYGTKPASFLAIRVLHQLAEDEKTNFPNASEVVKRDFYVDDLLTGANSYHDLTRLKDELIALLQRGGFTLHKWITNSQEKYDETMDRSEESINLDKTNESKLLGILWNHQRDFFHYMSSNDTSSQTRITKRTMLSEVSKIFDPLGLVGPVIVAAKILIQKIWCLKLNWDDSVPMQIQKDWSRFKAQLPMLNSIVIPRRITTDGARSIQLHGFSDASQQAYGACVYIRHEIDKNNIKVKLICAKSRVAPIKVITLPRLELCGAVLLTKLMRKVIYCLDVDVNNIYYWTDSKIVLAWLNAPAKRWQTFVANRVSEIQGNSSVSNWRHVGSKDNPADAISRGLTPAELLQNTSWWEGPPWMKTVESAWPSEGDDLLNTVVPEGRKETCIFVNIKHEEFELFHRYSSLSKLIRVTAYILRFYNNIKFKNNRKTSRLEVAELNDASITLVRVVQINEFKEEVKNLRKGESVSGRSSLSGLNPFIDDRSILRVGGRLKHAAVPLDSMHPIILPAKHVFTKLMIQDEHRMLMHAGTQSTLASIRRKYWLIAGRSIVRKIIKNCIICCKAKPMANPPLMGQLPAPRVNVARPFFNTGVDYCGPFVVRERVKRNGKTHKAYVAVFVCMAVKAVHLELVEELTTDAFLATFKRFISRRGKVSNMYSDNATNFVGADRELQRFFNESEHKDTIVEAASKEQISWHFITPRAPHFGGLWESAVKSFKFHFKREAGEAALTYIEFQTLLAQIEAILNSRPLTPLSDDPLDLEPLTPGHFLIGDALTSYPEPDLRSVPTNRLSRWQLVERIKQHFWSRWSREYLSICQQRSKWKKNVQSTIKVGKLVMLREEETIPFRWCMARIEEVHPGEDDIIRTVTLRTKKGLFKRPMVKVCPLPIELE